MDFLRVSTRKSCIGFSSCGSNLCFLAKPIDARMWHRQGRSAYGYPLSSDESRKNRGKRDGLVIVIVIVIATEAGCLENDGIIT
jgi:hypothetical protein